MQISSTIDWTAVKLYHALSTAFTSLHVRTRPEEFRGLSQGPVRWISIGRLRGTRKRPAMTSSLQAIESKTLQELGKGLRFMALAQDELLLPWRFNCFAGLGAKSQAIHQMVSTLPVLQDYSGLHLL